MREHVQRRCAGRVGIARAIDLAGGVDARSAYYLSKLFASFGWRYTAITFVSGCAIGCSLPRALAAM